MEGIIVEFDQALGSPGNLSIVLENLLHFPDSAVLTVSDALELQEASEQQFLLNMRIQITVSLKLLYFVLLCITYLKEDEIRKC